MINYDESPPKIILGDRVDVIKEFTVWWNGPTGLIPTLEMAQHIHKMLGVEVPFYMTWKATPVAIGVTGLYEAVE
jgi:hypothetical protein